jgi:Protein of unknown function (DUF2933)
MNSMLAETGLPAPLTSESHQRKPRAWGAALLMVALIAGFYLLREHWNHVSGTWPYLLLLACPLMHLFHVHGGHDKHDSHGPRPRQE